MKRRILQLLQRVPKVGFLRSRGKMLHTVHRLAFATILRPAGFKFEKRRKGDLVLGLLRKEFRKTKGLKRPRRLVIIPGLGDTPLGWMGPLLPLLPSLKDHYDEILFVDFPGFAGFLSKEDPIHSFDILREFLFDTLDTLRPEVMLGHSLGGWLTAQYAADYGASLRPHHPNRHPYAGPKKVVLVNSAGLKVDLEEMQVWENLFRRGIDEGFEAYRPHIFAKEPLWFPLIAPEIGRFMQNKSIQDFMLSIKEEHMVNERLGDTKAEVIMLWGKLDTLSPVHWMDAWLETLDDQAQGFRIDGAGHSPHIEKPWTTIYLLSRVLAHRTVSHSRKGRWEQVQKS